MSATPSTPQLFPYLILAHQTTRRCRPFLRVQFPPQHHPSPAQHHPTPPQHPPPPPAVKDPEAQSISVAPPAPLLLPRLFLAHQVPLFLWIRSPHQMDPPSVLQVPPPGFRRPHPPTVKDLGAQSTSAIPRTPLLFPRPFLVPQITRH